MKNITGNLIELAKDKQFDVIVHGCNCFNTMGAGIAYQIKRAFPSAYLVDQATILGDKSKLGTISLSYDSRYDLYIVNAYTQFNTSTMETVVDYDALEHCFKQIKTLFHTKKIAYPAIGCGLAGGNWDIVSKIIDITLTDDVNHTFVEWLS